MLKNIAELFYKACLLTITEINNNNKNLSQRIYPLEVDLSQNYYSYIR